MGNSICILGFGEGKTAKRERERERERERLVEGVSSKRASGGDVEGHIIT